MIQVLISQSPNIQKVLAFEGAFERLFGLISHEGGVDGGAVAQLALSCVDGLLRFNTSNQVIFKIFQCYSMIYLYRAISEKQLYLQPCAHFYNFPQRYQMMMLHHKNLHFNFGMTGNRRIRLL